ncbi:hypothetical protein AYI70_g512 [Smittium culicis]|uniref:Uncharacterized protein n=1 Tax=Smittium culicis TaxID=133412 RepID=A0A1R1YGI1_9FUNG|nr:hypothetical protein AYI70_g512 [Smittium culicis]
MHDQSGSPDYETRADNYEINYVCMDVRDLVSRNAITIDFLRKVPIHKEQELESNGMDNQRSSNKDKVVSNAEIEFKQSAFS